MSAKSSIIVFVLILLMSKQSFSQIGEFEKLKQEMFFNIYAFNPDSSVIDFVQKYYPIFCSPPERHEWAIYPPEEEVPQFMNTVHSLIFKQHPFFECKFREGRLDFITSETKNGGRGPQGLRLWFMFDSKTDALVAFNKLKSNFNKVSTIKKITQKNGRIIANYTDKEILLRTNSVEFILTNDELYDNKYKIMFRIGSFTYPNKKNAGGNDLK